MRKYNNTNNQNIFIYTQKKRNPLDCLYQEQKISTKRLAIYWTTNEVINAICNMLPLFYNSLYSHTHIPWQLSRFNYLTCVLCWWFSVVALYSTVSFQLCLLFVLFTLCFFSLYQRIFTDSLRFFHNRFF